MIKIFFISLFTLFTFESQAQMTLNQCESDAADNLSRTTIQKKISPDCAPLIAAQRNHLNEDNSIDNYVEVTGHKNILFIKEYGLDLDNNVILVGDRFVAGPKTTLTDIKALDFNEGDSIIYVLNNDNGAMSISSFYYSFGGNLSPSRILNSSELTHATNLRVDDTSKMLFVLSQTQAWIKVFNKNADPRGLRAENSLNLQRSIYGAPTGLSSPVDMAILGTEIFVLDSDRVLVFNTTDNGPVSYKRSISGPATTLSGAKRIDINSNNELVIINGDNSTVKFSSTASGNVAPL